MNLIEQLGGYEKAKIIQGSREMGGLPADLDLEDALLEYRRQHNIFEAGDLVVLPHTNYRSDVLALTKSFKEIYDAKGIVYCHATDAEIKAGKRLESCL